MNNKSALIASFLTFFLAGCTTPRPTVCTITPPNSDKADDSVTLTASANALSKASSSITGPNLSGEVKSTVDNTFQKLSDKNAACEMSLQAVMCLSSRKDSGGDQLASELIDYIQQKNVCAPGLFQQYKAQ